MPFCIKCGEELLPNAKFCHRCGHGIVPTLRQKPAPTPPPSEKIAKPVFQKIELKVYQHIKRHRGELDVKKCAKRLGVSEEDVKRAVESLIAKGKLERE